MVKIPTAIRLEPELKEALKRAAKADARTTASLINKILADWIAFSWPEPIDLDDIKDVRGSLQITLASIERRAERSTVQHDTPTGGPTDGE